MYDFIRRHPTGVDSFWAVLLLMMSIPSILKGAEEDVAFVLHGVARELAAIPVVLALAVVVAFRRRAPERMLLLAVGAGLAQVLTGVSVLSANFAFLAIIYTAASRSVRWASRFALACALAVPTAEIWRWQTQGVGLGEGLIVTAFLTVPFLFAWVLGDSMRTRRAYYAQLEERATRLEREREAQAQIAAAAERSRIARELHDVVAHNVSVMVVQADGAAYVLDSAPGQTKQALETISGTGRQALAEMRRLLGVLRSGEGRELRPTAEQGEGAEESGRGPADEYVPQPGVEEVAELVDAARGAGMTVHFAVEGAPRPLPSSLELTAYRVVQEALTNSRKHGGPDVTATVRLRYASGELSLLAEDDGCGGTGGTGDVSYEGGGADGLGHGLIGMRERVGMVGGSLRAGPRPGGGFRIRAELPLKGAD